MIRVTPSRRPAPPRRPCSSAPRRAKGVRQRAMSVGLVTLVAAVVVLAALAGSASAYDPEYYDDPAYATALASIAVASGAAYTGASLEAGMNTGSGYASASQAATIRANLLNARWASKALPAARTLGTIGLGVAAFDLGWKIGRTIDTKWLGLSALASGEFGFDDHYGLVRDTSYGWAWKWSSAAGEWRLNVYSSYGSPCGLTDVIPSTFTGTLLDLWGGDRTQCKQFLLERLSRSS